MRWRMMKLSWIPALLFFVAIGSVYGEELRIITFNYPPYTVQETRNGLVENRVNRALAAQSIKVKWEYFPVARSFQEFLADGEAVFAGNIGQFSDSEQKTLRSVVTLKTTEYAISRTELKGQSLRKKTFVGLRHDGNLVSQAKKYESHAVEVSSMQQAFEMVSLGRADFVFCLDREIDALKKYPNLIILPEHTSTLELQLIYHHNSKAGEIVRKGARVSNGFSR